MASAPPIVVNILGNASGINSTLLTVNQNLRGFSNSANAATEAGGGLGSLTMGGLITELFKVAAVVEGIKMAWHGVKESFSQAASMEDFFTTFKVLLGSVDAAKQRMAELADWESKTPFKFDEVANASRMLEVLTKGALSTTAGMTLVGDVAAGAGKGFEQVAMQVGRLYDGLQSGRPVGRAAYALQQFGVISGDTRNKLEELQKEGKKGPEVWAVAERSMGRFSGALAERSQTWNGLMSTLHSNINLSFAAFGAPLIDVFKPVLQGAINLLKQFRPMIASWGEAIANAAGMLMNAFNSGDLATILALSLKIGSEIGVNYLLGGIKTAFEIIGDVLMAEMKMLFSGDYWKQLALVFEDLGAILVGSLSVLGASILEGLEKPIEFLRAGMEFVGDLLATGMLNAGLTFKNILLEAVKLLNNAIIAAEEFFGMDTSTEKKDNEDIDRDIAANNKEKQTNLDNTPTFDQDYDKAKKEGLSGIGIDTKGAREQGKQLVADASRSLVEDYSKGFNQFTKPVINDIIGDVSRFKPADVFDPSKDRSELNGLLEKNKYTRKKPTEPTSKGAFAGTEEDTGPSEKKGAKGDSLTEVGGGGGVSLPYGNLGDKVDTTNTILDDIKTNTTPTTQGGNAPAIGGGSTATDGGLGQIASILTANGGILSKILDAIKDGSKGTANFPTGGGLILERTG